MDVRNGEVLALASAPSFDPNAFYQRHQRRGMARAARQRAGAADQQGDRRPVRARLDLQDGGRPGGARGGAITPGARACSAPATASSATRNFHCWKKGGHGARRHGRAASSIPATSISTTSREAPASTASPRWHAASASARRSASTLPGERPGLIPTRDWKQAITRPQPGSSGETLVAGIGQGYIADDAAAARRHDRAHRQRRRAVVPTMTRSIGAPVAAALPAPRSRPPPGRRSAASLAVRGARPVPGWLTSCAAA